jgi:hypothetical protein
MAPGTDQMLDENSTGFGRFRKRFVRSQLECLVPPAAWGSDNVTNML